MFLFESLILFGKKRRAVRLRGVVSFKNGLPVEVVDFNFSNRLVGFQFGGVNFLFRQ